MAVKDYPSQENYGRHGYVVLSITDNPYEYVIVRDCPLCGEESRVRVPSQGLWDWEHGMFIQRAMPDLPPEEREQALTGTHPQCWDAMTLVEE